MKRVFYICTLLCTTLCACTNINKTQKPTDFQSSSTIPSLQSFANHTFSNIWKKTENTCYSPLSFYIALQMLTVGTTDEVRDELCAFLVPKTKQYLLKICKHY